MQPFTWYRGGLLSCISSSDPVGSLPLLTQVRVNWLLQALRLQPVSVTPRPAGTHITGFTARAGANTGLRTIRVSQTILWEAEDRTIAQREQHCSPAFNTTKVPDIFHHIQETWSPCSDRLQTYLKWSAHNSCSQVALRPSEDRLVEKHYCFSNFWSRVPCFSTVNEEKIQVEHMEKENML